jgi:hypothetical protein
MSSKDSPANAQKCPSWHYFRSKESLIKGLRENVKADVLHAIVYAMSYTHILVIVAGAMAILGSLFMSVSEISLSQDVLYVFN